MLGYHDKPCALLNTSGYYDHLLAFVGQAVAEGFVAPRLRRCLLVAAEPPQALSLLERSLVETRRTAPKRY
jgi:predicted Rossmann-fold nucleotide-binding protein